MTDAKEFDESVRLGEALRFHREKVLGLTQAELAARLGGLVKQNTISTWENGARIPASMAKALAEVANVPPWTFSNDPSIRSERTIAVIWAQAKEEWENELRYAVETSLQKAGFLWQPFPPKTNFNWQEHEGLQQDVVRQRALFGACIDVVPIWGRDKLSAFNKFAKDFGKPIVFVDQDLSGVHPSSISPLTCYVSFSDTRGGRCAAAGALLLPNRRQIRRVVVLATPVKHPRHESFSRDLKSKLQDCAIETRVVAGYYREDAVDLVHNLMKKGLAENRPIDLFYCTSDSYALAFNEAAEDLLKTYDAPRPAAIGYDGTQEMKHLISKGRVSAAVEQNTAELAEIVVDSLRRFFMGRPPSRVSVLEPRLVSGVGPKVHAPD